MTPSSLAEAAEDHGPRADRLASVLEQQRNSHGTTAAAGRRPLCFPEGGPLLREREWRGHFCEPSPHFPCRRKRKTCQNGAGGMSHALPDGGGARMWLLPRGPSSGRYSLCSDLPSLVQGTLCLFRQDVLPNTLLPTVFLGPACLCFVGWSL